MKHIKVKARVCTDKKYFDMEVIQVTHEDYETFAGGQGLHSQYSRRLFAHKSVAIGYNGFSGVANSPLGIVAWQPPASVDTVIVVAADKTVYNVPSAKWPAIKAAIEAYNAFYADKE